MTLAPLGDATSLTRWATMLAPARQLAEIVSGTEFVPAALRGNPDAVCAAIMYGDEIGVGPMQALAGIHVVDGRPQPSAELARALILAAGHTITVHTSTDQLCKVSGLRAGAPEASRTYGEWSLDDARRAGLLRRQAWQQYPRAMLLARATGELARQAFPDAVKGLGHIAEDAADLPDAWLVDERPAEPAPATKTVRRRKPRAIAGQPVETMPLPEAVPDGEPEPGHPADPWKASLDPWAHDGDQSPGVPAAGAPPDSPAVPHAPQVAPTEPSSEPQASAVPDSLRKSLMAAASRLGIDPTADRAMRLALWSALMARPITTTHDLSRPEALTLLRRMNDCEPGAVEWDYSVETGAVTLRHIDREPPA